MARIPTPDRLPVVLARRRWRRCWRNRGKQDVTITLKTTGVYGEIKRMM